MGKQPEYKDWEEKELASSLKRFPERKKKFTNHGGEEIARLAVPDQIDGAYNVGLDYSRRLGLG